ncbi:hypothetical protein [Halostella sp. PRR32]|uniref:hypothetical protein n=1 Tax=Halostella sp. PRR32 TaxID=3098147 RepID=UPI002B1E40F7|nr:hypothetical protein [Halostella sp. PRR32]
MNRREMLLGSGIVLSTVLAGCSSGGSDDDDSADDNETDDTETDDAGGADEDTTNSTDTYESENAEFSAVYNYRRYDRLSTPDSEGVYYESDDENQYVGAQIKVTNETDGDLSMQQHALYVLADGGVDGVSIHGQSKTDPLESIGAGETIETWLIFVTPPGSELDFGTTQWAQHTFDLTHDENLEIALEEYDE